MRWSAVEGYNNENSPKNLEEMHAVPLTRPADAGHPLPSGEGLARNIPQFGQLCLARRDGCSIRNRGRRQGGGSRKILVEPEPPPRPLALLASTPPGQGGNRQTIKEIVDSRSPGK